jgi:hypothetical protein
MKKSLLAIALFTGALAATAQTVVFEVLTPASVTGLYPVEYVPAGAVGWSAVPDLFNVDNAITGELVFASDGTAGDSLACNPLVNGDEVSGKIAVIWRGVCPFALKAFHAWEAGAIGVMLVNNAVGSAPIVPGAAAGGAGETVDVPVAMTDRTTGELLRPHILAGTATAFLGAVPDFQNDLTLTPDNIIRSLGAVFPLAVRKNSAEFTVPMGARVINSGGSTQTGVTLNATISLNGNIIYNETSTATSIAPSSEVLFSLPAFTQAIYSAGFYQVTYTVAGNEQDEFPADNVADASFALTPENNATYALTAWNPATQDVVSSQWLTPATFNEFLEICSHFQDPNASRLELSGITFATWNFDAPLTGEIIDVTAYKWNNQFSSLQEFFDSGLPLQIEEWDFGVYEYTENLLQQNVFVPFENQLQLEDNQRYLFCFLTTNPSVRVGHAPSSISYELANSDIDAPLTTVGNAANIFLRGWAGGQQSGAGVRFFVIPDNTSDVDKVSITPYPNPTRDFITLPYSGTAVAANLLVYDLNGRMVKSERVNFGGNNMFQADMSGVPNGTYVFTLQFDDNTASTFKVVVTK